MQKILNDSHLGDNLLRIRKMRNMTQNDVIAKMQILGSNLSVTAYSKIEHGIRNIKVTDLVGLKNVFNVDYSEFFVAIPHC